MDDYMSARAMCISQVMTARCVRTADVFRPPASYACDMFIGSTLQIDLEVNSSTVTPGA